MDGDWGHVRAAGIAAPGGLPEHRSRPTATRPATKTGYGLNLSGTLKVFGKDKLNWQRRLGQGASPAT